MKKIQILLFVVFILCKSISYSQFFEGFENGVPGSMIQTYINGTIDFTNCDGITGGLLCPFTGDGTASFFVNWSEEHESTSLETPLLNISSGVYRLEFDHAQKYRSGQNSLLIEISTDSGVNFTTIVDYTQEIAVWTHEILYFFMPISSNEVILRFTATNDDGYSVLLDNILIEEALSIDLGIDEVNLPPIIPFDTTTLIEGTVNNYGVDVIYSFDLNWQDNNGSINTHTFTNLYIPTDETYNFSHNQTWFVNSGFHILDVWISNINGGGNDMNSENDRILLEINSPSQTVSRIPVYEEFTSSTCGGCHVFNIDYFNAELLDDYEGLYALVKYEMNWPSTGDDYYTPEGGIRSVYYNVNSIPSLFLDAVYGTFWDQQELLDHFISTAGEPSYIELSATHTFIDEDVNITVDINSFLKGNYTLNVIVYENETLLNASAYGEPHLNVMMKMIPDAEGTPLSLEIDVPQTLTFDMNLSDTFIEEFDDLGVAVFIQDDTNKMMMQGANSVDTSIGVDDERLTQFRIYPNPGNDIVKINSDYEIFESIKVYTLQGVFVKEIQNATEIDISNLVSGMYLLKLTIDDKYFTTKFIKN